MYGQWRADVSSGTPRPGPVVGRCDVAAHRTDAHHCAPDVPLATLSPVVERCRRGCSYSCARPAPRACVSARERPQLLSLAARPTRANAAPSARVKDRSAHPGAAAHLAGRPGAVAALWPRRPSEYIEEGAGARHGSLGVAPRRRPPDTPSELNSRISKVLPKVQPGLFPVSRCS